MKYAKAQGTGTLQGFADPRENAHTIVSLCVWNAQAGIGWRQGRDVSRDDAEMDRVLVFKNMEDLNNVEFLKS